MAEELARNQIVQSLRELKKEVVALQRKEARLVKSLGGLERTVVDSVRNLEGMVERLQQELADRDRKLHTLEQSELRLRTLIERSGHPMTLYDREGRVLLMNKSGARNIEASHEDF
jgi:PAS domain-containing protein